MAAGRTVLTVRCLLGVCPGPGLCDPLWLDAAWVLPVCCGRAREHVHFSESTPYGPRGFPGCRASRAFHCGPTTSPTRAWLRAQLRNVVQVAEQSEQGTLAPAPNILVYSERRAIATTCVLLARPRVHVALPRGHLRSCCALRALARRRPAAGPCIPRLAGLLRARDAVLARGRGAGLGHHFLGRRRRSGPGQRANHSFRDVL